MVNPEKALEDSNPLKVKEEPVSDLAFTLNEEAEGELTLAEQAMSAGVLGMSSDRLAGGLEDGHSPHTSGTKDEAENLVLNIRFGLWPLFWPICISQNTFK